MVVGPFLRKGFSPPRKRTLSALPRSSEYLPLLRSASRKSWYRGDLEHSVSRPVELESCQAGLNKTGLGPATSKPTCAAQPNCIDFSYKQPYCHATAKGSPDQESVTSLPQTDGLRRLQSLRLKKRDSLLLLDGTSISSVFDSPTFCHHRQVTRNVIDSPFTAGRVPFTRISNHSNFSSCRNTRRLYSLIDLDT